jgi:hypothetical protein
MNFGLIVFAWVFWICAHGVDKNVPKPADGWMFAALSVAFFMEPTTLEAFKECVYKAFVAGFHTGYDEAEDDHAISLEAESDY